MHSILYEQNGSIHQIGPFDTDKAAMAAAKKAEISSEFDIHEQRVYYLGPDHRMQELSIDDVLEADDG